MNLLNNKVMKYLPVFCTLFFIVFILGKSLNPNSHSMFLFHDQTQAARLSQFALSVQNGQIPPRIAPDFSFHLSYPIFTYYAPASYIITQMLSYFGYSVAGTIQLSFLVGIVVAFFGAYFLLLRIFKSSSALVGAVTYILTLYVPLTIFVRGNLAEFWLISLLPLGFLAVMPSSKLGRIHSILRIIVLILLFSSHNALSIFAGLYLLLYLIYTRANKYQWLVYFAGVFGSLYFYLPFIFESSQIWAREVALKTNFRDHFLCIGQLWSGNWGFGGSAPGCLEDGMSFKQGKIPIVLFVLTTILVLRNKFYIKNNTKLNTDLPLFFVVATFVAIFMTTALSSQIWDRLFILPLVQYPWRFLAFLPLGFAVTSGYVIDNINKKYQHLVAVAVIVVLFAYHGKYFYGKNMLKSQYEHTYASRQYVATKAAYLVPEYLPKTVDYDYWRSFESIGGKSVLPFFDQPIVVSEGKYEIIKNSPFQKIVKVAPQEKLVINLHYMPMWSIVVNNKPFFPDNSELDRLGRPNIRIVEDSVISIVYKQTRVQFWGLACLVLAVILGGLVPSIQYAKNRHKQRS